MKLPRMFRKSASVTTPADAQPPKVFVVLDTKGSGRIVGVFEREAQALEILAVSPQYYRVFPLRLNEINPECVRWIQDEKGRDSLQRLSAQLRAIPEDESG
jgi:hypothetical protein